MADQTILILPTASGSPARAINAAGSQDLALDQLGAIAAGDLIVVLPGQNIRSFATELPKASRAQQLKAARFAHEGQIATGLDTLHVALSNNDPIVTSFIDRTWLQSCLDGLRAQGLSPKYVLADYDALQTLSAPVHLLDRAVTPGPDGFAQDLDWAERAERLPDDQVYRAVTEALRSGQTTNLLQGEFRPRSQLSLGGAGLGRLGALAAACAIVFLGWQGVKARGTSLQAEAIRTDIAQMYQDATGQPAPANPARAAAAALQNPQADQKAFLQLSNVLFAAMRGMDDVSVDRLSYNAARQELQLRLVYPDFDGAGRVERAVQSAGGDFVTGGVREQGGDFVGEAVLRLGGPS